MAPEPKLLEEGLDWVPPVPPVLVEEEKEEEKETADDERAPVLLDEDVTGETAIRHIPQRGQTGKTKRRGETREKIRIRLW